MLVGTFHWLLAKEENIALFFIIIIIFFSQTRKAKFCLPMLKELLLPTDHYIFISWSVILLYGIFTHAKLLER